MDRLKPVSRVTVGEQVALQLAGMIREGRWRTGDKLPPEGELCRALGIGRSTLREALKSLAFIGMVRMRAGDGTYVLKPTQKRLQRKREAACHLMRSSSIVEKRAGVIGGDVLSGNLVPHEPPAEITQEKRLPPNRDLREALLRKMCHVGLKKRRQRSFDVKSGQSLLVRHFHTVDSMQRESL